MNEIFYTNCQVHGSKILYRGVENGRSFFKTVDYFPTLFVPSKEPTKYRTIHGKYVAPIKPGSIRDTKEFIKTYEDVNGFEIYGNNRFEYCFISDTYRDDVKWDRNFINVCNIDIEVASEGGFPEPELANEEIQSITFKTNNAFVVLGCKPFNNKRSDVKYIQCRNEID